MVSRTPVIPTWLLDVAWALAVIVWALVIMAIGV